MKKLLFISILFQCCHYSEAQNFEVEIWQNDKKLKIKKDIVKLKKAPFQIKVKLQNLEGVYVIPSYSGELSKVMQENFKHFSAFTLGTDTFNEEEFLVISDEAIHYLFFKPKKYDWHRFDKNGIEKIENGVGTRTVKMFEDDLYNQNILVKHMTKDVYLVFMTTEKNKEGNTLRVLREKKILLSWK